jgi:lipoprotein
MKYLIVIPLMLLLGCVEKQQNTQNIELFEEANKKEILF